MLRPFGVEIVLDPFAEVLHREGKAALGSIDPLLSRFLA